MKMIFYEAVAVSIVPCGHIIWILTKCLERNRNSN